ncbi:O-antigen ligase family protein [Novipirellula sp.]|uniref:O-antigen ligase family protein n=1 Tax=Novipirellula sp. TaxID=2795430 RepID=UPI003569F5EC
MDANQSPDPLPKDQPPQPLEGPVQPQRVSAPASQPRAASVRSDSSHRQPLASAIQPMRTTSASSTRGSKRRGQVLTNDFAAWEWGLLNLARATTIAAFIYTCWRFGGTDVIVWYHVAAMLAASLVMSAIVWRKSRRQQPLPVPALLFGVICVTVPMLQTIELPREVINWIAPGTERVIREFSSPAINQLELAIHPLQGDGELASSASSNHSATISIVPSSSHTRLALWQLGFVFFAISTTLFFTRESRKVLAWTLAINAAGLAFWGLVQRSSGSSDLLPGMTKDVVTLPFSTFVYKNAGAAALIPGLAAIIGLIGIQRQSPTGIRKSTRESRGIDSYRPRPRWTDPRFLLLLCFVGLLAAGLLASSSRGVWISGAVAGLALFITVPSRFSGKTLFAAVFIAGCCIGLIALTGLRNELAKQSQRLNIDQVSTDARFTHWRDGIDTAIAHLPFGSGLGTFGYAHLPQQENDTEQWFREAHNQYLEILVETGVFGVIAIAVVILLLGRSAIFLIRKSASQEHFSWGIIGLFSLASIVTQSFVDFVVLIPGVMFTQAILLGCMAAVYTRDLSLSKVLHRRSGQLSAQKVSESKLGDLASTPLRDRMLQVSNRPLTWCFVSSVVVLFAFIATDKKLQTENALANTQFSSEDYEPSPEEIDFNLLLLSDAIERDPKRWELYRRRSLWHLAEYRLGLLAKSSADESSLTWSQTSLDNLFQSLYSLTQSDRDGLIHNVLVDPKLRDSLALAIADQENTLQFNPLSPNTYLSCAMLTPLLQRDTAMWEERIAKLSHSSRGLQYAGGMVAYFAGNRDNMVDQWRRSLKFGDDYYPAVLQLAGRKLSLEEFLNEIIPAERNDLAVRFVSEAGDFTVNQHTLRRLRDQVLMRIQSDSSRDEAEKMELSARVEESGKNWGEAATYWSLALRLQPHNLDYRYYHCRALYHDDQLKEALDQATLLRALEPATERSEKTIEAIKKRIEADARKSVH